MKRAILKGIIPPLTTPFDSDDEIDEACVKAQVRFMIEQGVHGLAVGGSTGEGHTLEISELQRLVAAAVAAADDKVPVIAGIIVDSTRDAIRRGLAVKELGALALQVTPVHYLFRPDDEAMVGHFAAMASATGLPIIIYNVVPWTYLSPRLLIRIMRTVPEVIGVKQSAGDMKLLADLLLLAEAEDHIFSAVDALMYPSFVLGARGAIAAILAAAPKPCVDLWQAVQTGDHPRALQLHQQLLPLWNAMNGDNLPACVKYAQTLQGCPALAARAPMPAADARQQQAIREALGGLGITFSQVA